MFQIFNTENGDTFYTDSPRYVKQDSRGIWQQCNANDAQCVAVDGKRFSILGKQTVDDAPTAFVSKVDAGEKLAQINFKGLENAQNIDEVKTAILDIQDAVLDIYLNGLEGE